MRRDCLALLFGSLLVAPTSSTAAAIRDDGLLEVRGEALFPLGLMDLGLLTYRDWNARIRDSGVNLVWDVQLTYGNVNTCRAILDSVRAAGYHLLVGSYDSIAWDDPATPEVQITAPMYEPDKLEDLRLCLERDPEVLIGFSNRDEPAWTLANGWIGDIDADHILDTYRQLHEAFPGALVATNFAPAHASGDFGAWRLALDPFLDATDIVMHASYPYPAGPGTCAPVNVLGWPDCSLDRLPDNADIFLSGVNRPGQPLWMIIQAFKGIPRREARWQAYAAIVHGATGLVWAGWTWYHELGTGAQSWEVIERVTREVSELHDFLVGPDVSGVGSDHPDVEVRAKQSGREIAVFAVSRRGFAGPATLRLPRLGRGEIEVVGEQRSLAAERGLVTDEFDRYEAHVYRYRARYSSSPVDDGPLALSARYETAADRVGLSLRLPRRAAVTVTVHDVHGRRTALAGTGVFEAGTVDMTWNGRSFEGAPVAPGVYFLRAVTSRGRTASAKVVITR